MASIKFNYKIKLALSDVDETIADVYTPASQEIIYELDRFIEKDRILFLVSGGGLQSIRERVADRIRADLRHKVIIAHCTGAEVWGYKEGGKPEEKPYFGVYDDQFNDDQKKLWRKVVEEVIKRFDLKVFPPQTKVDFDEISKGDPQCVMLADRGPQITLEFINSINLNLKQVGKLEKDLGIKILFNHGAYDLRIPVMKEFEKLYTKYRLPIIPRLGGIFGLDSVIEGVDKTRAVKYVLENEGLLKRLGFRREDINDIDEIEIWGDKYSQKKGGPDFDMCRAVDTRVRAIDFRQEEPEELPEGYNIKIWDGKKHLHEGLLEYLKTS